MDSIFSLFVCFSSRSSVNPRCCSKCCPMYETIRRDLTSYSCCYVSIIINTSRWRGANWEAMTSQNPANILPHYLPVGNEHYNILCGVVGVWRYSYVYVLRFHKSWCYNFGICLLFCRAFLNTFYCNILWTP